MLGCYAGSVFSSDAGPADILLESSGTKKMPPAVFPHKLHQDAFACGDCHHGMQDGKVVPYSDGMEIQKCEACHNSEVLAGKTAGKEKLDTFKGAGHANCLECHKEIAAKDESKKALRGCKACHQK
ncbi:MAG: cytochrome c3 family protein [Desulfopila sp.]|nr:cytochrome c3 family protein [Desulfopila sp.]